jgi:two-component system KDP operon response regulator KdpE
MANMKILLIDDEPLLVKSTCMALKYRGFETRGALGGEKGLAEAEVFEPDIVLLDIMMPGMDGWEVLRRLKSGERTRDIAVIMFTAKEYSDGAAVARERGADGFIAKPFEVEDLCDRIREVEESDNAGAARP